MKISRVDLLLNLQVDESYTPRVVQIKIGDSPTTLHVAKEAEYEPGARDEGAAWWSILLHPKDALRAKHAGRLPFEDAPDEALSPFYAWLDTLDYVGGFCLQIAILQTFHEGRDVHVRQVGPRPLPDIPRNAAEPLVSPRGSLNTDRSGTQPWAEQRETPTLGAERRLSARRLLGGRP
ncbi:anaphase-promoting complex subunit APC10 [Toxoplasma gondii MAS]|uniref:Anaphase-promoting complex subunit APC10 n=1 Tax=Toxoplasma gondii MAS TaxID=943118 RepID=A0A086Q8W9_TOXGO|nr:anaphase-promoting complex subunit APC10 [Toxoplasma gondii MAS]